MDKSRDALPLSILNKRVDDFMKLAGSGLAGSLTVKPGVNYDKRLR